jgi:ferredoxin-like protein FixX
MGQSADRCAAQPSIEGEPRVALGKRMRRDNEVDLQRRSFISTLLGDSCLEPRYSRRLLSAERIALLKGIAARWEGTLPPGAIVQVEVNDACAHHAVCAAVCPTAALQPYADDGHAGLEFDASACIACGACAMVCPENALAIRAVAPAVATGVAVRITRHEQHTCVRCDEVFAARGDEGLCPACRKDVGLFTLGFSDRSDEA